jgi:hypothetical protein
MSVMDSEPGPALTGTQERVGLPAGPPRIEPRGRAARLLAGWLRFFGLWAGISGTYALMCGTCPFCGRPGCPVGLGVAGIFGASGSLLLTQGRHVLAVIRRRLTVRSR